MTNKINKINNNDVIMETLRTSVESFNNSAPAEFAIGIDTEEYIRFCDNVISQIKETPVTSLNISTISAIITKVLTNYVEDKLGKKNIVLNIYDIIESGALRSIADNAISDGNLRLANQGYNLRLHHDEFYNNLVAMLKSLATNGKMEMMEINQTAMALLCHMTDEMISKALSSQEGYVS